MKQLLCMEMVHPEEAVQSARHNKGLAGVTLDAPHTASNVMEGVGELATSKVESSHLPTSIANKDVPSVINVQWTGHSHSTPTRHSSHTLSLSYLTSQHTTQATTITSLPTYSSPSNYYPLSFNTVRLAYLPSHLTHTHTFTISLCVQQACHLPSGVTSIAVTMVSPNSWLYRGLRWALMSYSLTWWCPVPTTTSEEDSTSGTKLIWETQIGTRSCSLSGCT